MKLKVIKYHIYTYILDYYEHKDIKKIIEKHCLMKKKIKWEQWTLLEVKKMRFIQWKLMMMIK